MTSRHSHFVRFILVLHAFKLTPCSAYHVICVLSQVIVFSHISFNSKRTSTHTHSIHSHLHLSALCFHFIFSTFDLFVSLYSTLTSYRTQSLVFSHFCSFAFCYSLAHTRSQTLRLFPTNKTTINHPRKITTCSKKITFVLS